MATAALVEIPGVTSSQIVNNTSVPLKSGALTLTEPLAGVETEAKLFLNIKPDDEEKHPLTFPLLTEACLGSKEGGWSYITVLSRLFHIKKKRLWECRQDI